MAERSDRSQDWRRFDEDEDFNRRPGALDRRWGYGDRLAPSGGRQARRPGREEDYPDDYNAPDYWVYQEAWMRPGPHTGKGPKNYRRSDERIRDDVCDRLTQHAQIDASDIEVQVEGGEVTVSGTVQDRRMKRMVEDNIEMIPGVIDVHNRLTLKKQPDPREEEKQRRAREMADRFPGGPTPTGPAAQLEDE